MLLSACSNEKECQEQKQIQNPPKIEVSLSDIQKNLLWAIVLKDANDFFENPIADTQYKKFLKAKFDYVYAEAFNVAYIYGSNKLQADERLKGKIIDLRNCNVRAISEMEGMPTLQCDTRRDGYFNEPILFFDRNDQRTRKQLIEIFSGQRWHFFCIGNGSLRSVPIFVKCRFLGDVINDFILNIRDEFLNDNTYVKAIKNASERLTKKQKEACTLGGSTCYEELNKTKFSVIKKSLEVAYKQSTVLTKK